MLGPFLNQTTFEITFDNNPERKYYAGQKISGYIRLTLHKEHTLRGIFIKILGKAHADWSNGSVDSARNHRGEEILINEKKYVAGSKSGYSTYAPAEYTYPFDWDLPAELPISFEGSYGYIRYNVVAGLDRPLRPDKCYTELFTLMKRIDLNEMPDLNNSMELEKISKFAGCCLLCCCFLSSPLIIKASILVGGYVPSETISLDLRLVNNSNIAVKSITCKFVQTITYHSHKSSKFHEKVDTVTLVEQVCNGCPANSMEQQNINTLIPAGLLPTEINSNICMIQYSLVITGSIPGCHVNPVLTIPIILGTVPLNIRTVEYLEAFPSLNTAYTFDNYNPNEFSSTHDDALQRY